MLRGYAKYLRQIGSPYTQGYLESVLVGSAALTAKIAELFAVRFDPDASRAAPTTTPEPRPPTTGRSGPVSWPPRSTPTSTRWPAWTRTVSSAVILGWSWPPGAPTPTGGTRTARGGRSCPTSSTPGACPAAETRSGARDLGVLTASGGGAPPVRRHRPRRAALVGPAGGLPHRDPRPGQGPGGEERRHRAGRREGRFRRQAAAAAHRGPDGRPRGQLAEGVAATRCSSRACSI